jgi:hypothetical protein
VYHSRLQIYCISYVMPVIIDVTVMHHLYANIPERYISALDQYSLRKGRRRGDAELYILGLL